MPKSPRKPKREDFSEAAFRVVREATEGGVWVASPEDHPAEGSANAFAIPWGMRRFTRLTNGYSKKFENHCAAVEVHMMHYNWCRPHATLTGNHPKHYPVTPAMAAGLRAIPGRSRRSAGYWLVENDNTRYATLKSLTPSPC